MSIIFKIKLLVVFLFVGVFTINAADNIARNKINLKFENATIKSIISSIEKQTDYIFIYNVDAINSNSKRSITTKDADIEKVLDILFTGMDVEIKIDGRQVYIVKKMKPLPEKPVTVKKSNTVTGVITDEKKQTVIGANVVVEGSTTGTITDVNGFFSIEAPADAKLRISYIGYETQLVDVRGKSSLNVIIFPSINILDELVVVGYGLQKKSDVTGSIGQVKADQIKNTASANVASALQGKVSGVYIMNSSGSAGAGVDISIRGMTSLNGVTPLWIIDGVPGDASTVNMNDVENIDIIKDGTAAAIYGVKAAAGVILVTTKRGTGQKNKISFNTYTGSSSAWRLPEMLNSDQYITLKNEQWASTGVPVGLSMDSIGKYPTTNWMKEMFRIGKVQNYDLNISGANEFSNYYIGGTYFRNDPSFFDNSLEKFSFRINSDHKISKWIKIGESLSLIFSKLNPVADEGRYLDGIFRTPPMMPVYDENNQPGGFGYVDAVAIGNYDGGNPMANQLVNQGSNNGQIISGNVYATINVAKGLTVTGTFAGNFNFTDYKSITLPYKLNDRKGNATTNIGVGFSKSWNLLFNVYANYVKDFGLNNINFTAGYETKQNYGSYVNASGINAKYGLQVLNQTDVVGRTAYGSESIGRALSQFGRLTYQYDNKYVAQAVIRRDGSDKFGPENRYGLFPSFSLAWKISEEDFMKNIPAISFLKLRGGYGVNGNDNIAQFQYVASMDTWLHGYPFGDYANVVEYTSVATSQVMANPLIKWERSKQLDMGLELGMFKNALFINIEPYQKISDQMLFKKALPLSSGLSEFKSKPYQIINTGKLTNWGLDFSVTYKGNVKDFKYSLGANMSTVKSTVNQLVDNTPLLSGGVLVDGVQISKTTVGESSAYFFGYQCDGIFQTQEQVDAYNNNARSIAKELNPSLSEAALSGIYYNSNNTAPGDLIYRDIDGNGRITPEDREKIGTPWPRATYGLMATAQYKWFDLQLSAAGIYKRDVFNASRVSMYQFSSYDYSTTTLALTRWTPDNPSTINYRINGSDPNKNMANPSSWYIEDGSFLRIKNLELGFTLPQVWSDKAGLSRFRLYVSGQNLLTVTKYTGLDPEFGMGSPISAGIDYGSYPQSRVYMMGLQVEL
ncbi:MAG: TonB-dependent receptor [Paludibacter sp.]|nr:TonB-dependent receptor [Paludibacter sp.]